MLTVEPLQMVAVFALLTVTGGITVTVTTCGVPTQDPLVDVGVTVYVTVSILVVLLVIASLKVLVVCVVVLSPVVFALFVAIQV